MFDLQIGRVTEWVRGRGFSSVAIQLPEGLKIRAAEISDAISSDTGAEVFILGYPCYGACDLFADFRRYAQGLVHFGHSPIPGMGAGEDVLFIEARADISVPDISSLTDNLPQRVGLLASVQYIGLLEGVAEQVRGSGRTAVIGRGDRRICYPGQVLGCNCSAGSSVEDGVDGFLFLGEGDFHPLAAAFGLRKPVTVLDPVTGEVRGLDGIRDRILRRRFAAIESARNAKSFMVILCGKAGQSRPGTAMDILGRIRGSGRAATLLVTDEITPESLLPYRTDAFVSTACPRIAIDDQ